jgi:hypothetical protein
MNSKMGHETIGTPSRIEYPGAIRSVQLWFVRKSIDALSPGFLRGAGKTRAAISDSQRGRHIEVVRAKSAETTTHTFIEVPPEEAGNSPSCITAWRDWYGNGGKDYMYTTRFSPAPNSDNSLSLLEVASSLRLARGLEPVPPDSQEHVLRVPLSNALLSIHGN